MGPACAGVGIGAKMDIMNGEKSKYLVRLLGCTFLLCCLFGVGFRLSSDSVGNDLTPLLAKVNTAYADQGDIVARPEIDLQFPEATEIALFALG